MTTYYELQSIKTQLAYYKGKCEVYEKFLMKAGLIEKPIIFDVEELKNEIKK